MALNKETADKLSAIGLDVQALTDAITSEEEKGLENIPEVFTKDQFESFGKNRFKEGKEAFSEIKAKELKEKWGIDVEGKDLDKVVETYVSNQIKEVGKGKDEWLSEKKQFQSKLQEYENQISSVKTEYENKLFNFEVSNKLKSLLPKDVPISGDLIIKSFMLDNSITKDDEGRAVIKKGDSILKDKMLNPIEVSDHFKSWLDENNIKSIQGNEGGDSGGGSSTPKFETISQFTDWAIQKGLEPMGEEAQNLLKENKVENFKYE